MPASKRHDDRISYVWLGLFLGAVFLITCGIDSLMHWVSKSYREGHGGSGTAFFSEDPEAARIVEGRNRLKSQLRDPDSVQIISEEVQGGRYNATYRAKNGFGGYVVEDYSE